MTAVRICFGASIRWTLLGATLALAIAILVPGRAEAAFSHFSGGVLTVHASEGKVVPRCEGNGELTVSGLPVQTGDASCRELRRVEATSFVGGLFDFSQLPDNLGGGQGPIEIHAFSSVDDPFEIADDKFIGASGHINIFSGGLGGDLMIGGNLNDQLSGGGESDKIEGGRGNDTLRGGAEPDKLLGGPGRDVLKGGGGKDKLIGGPGKDVEKQ